MTIPHRSDTLTLVKTAQTEKSPHSGGQRGARTVEAPYDTRWAVPLPSRPGRPGRGFPVIERHTRQVIPFRLSASRGFPTSGDTNIRACGPSWFASPAPVHPRCSRQLKRNLQAGWNRGSYALRLTPDTIRGAAFCFSPTRQSLAGTPEYQLARGKCIAPAPRFCCTKRLCGRPRPPVGAGPGQQEERRLPCPKKTTCIPLKMSSTATPTGIPAPTSWPRP